MSNYDIKVEDTIAWNVTVIVLYAFLTAILGFFVGMMLYWIILDGYMVFLEGLFMFLFLLCMTALIWNIVIKSKKIGRIIHERKSSSTG